MGNNKDKRHKTLKKKWKFRDYLRHGLIGGVWVGSIFAGATLLENISPDINHTIVDAIRHGAIAFLFLPAFFIIGFVVMEYIVPRMTNRRLRSPRYKFLHENGFIINKDYIFEGVYKGYHIVVIPIEDRPIKGKYVSYEIIESYYDLPDQETNEEKFSGKYYFGELTFGHHAVGFVPINHSNPNFEDALNGLVTVLTREKLNPITRNDWKKTYSPLNHEDTENDQ